MPITASTGRNLVHVFDLEAEQRFDTAAHVERILTTVGSGDVTVACWEPGQISPYHCHPRATEIYFCYHGAGIMRTPDEQVAIRPGAFVVHPPDELHEYENGATRTLLFRVRYGEDVAAHTVRWRGMAGWQPSAEDLDHMREHPEIPDDLHSPQRIDACRGPATLSAPRSADPATSPRPRRTACDDV